MIPSSFDHPLLPEESVMQEYLLRTIFQGVEIPDDRVRSFTLNLMLSADKARREYNAAVETMQRCVAAKGLMARLMLYIEALGRFETSLSSAHRAGLFVKRLKGSRVAHLDKLARSLILRAADDVNAARDTIEHMDERVVTGRVVVGDAHALKITPDGKTLEIGECRLDVAALFDQIGRLLRLSSALGAGFEQ